jgi:hypothetical protein
MFSGFNLNTTGFHYGGVSWEDASQSRINKKAGASQHRPASTFIHTGELGFEPRQTDPESVVLPLHYSPLRKLNLVVKGTHVKGFQRHEKTGKMGKITVLLPLSFNPVSKIPPEIKIMITIPFIGG